MKILFDNGRPNLITRSLAGHEVKFARQIGWHELKNGELLQQAEEAACLATSVHTPIFHLFPIT